MGEGEEGGSVRALAWTEADVEANVSLLGHLVGMSACTPTSQLWLLKVPGSGGNLVALSIPVPRPWFLIPSSTTRYQGSLEKWVMKWAGRGDVQEEPGTSYHAKRKQVLKEQQDVIK